MDLHVDSRSQIFKFQNSWCWNTAAGIILSISTPCYSQKSNSNKIILAKHPKNHRERQILLLVADNEITFLCMKMLETEGSVEVSI